MTQRILSLGKSGKADVAAKSALDRFGSKVATLRKDLESRYEVQSGV